MTETALAAKLKEKGITPRNVRIDMALAEFRNNGGTFSEGLERLSAAFGVGSEVVKFPALCSKSTKRRERVSATRRREGTVS